MSDAGVLRVRRLILLAAALPLAACSAGSSTPSGEQATATARQLVVGHRGASGHAPEHTIAAYDLALEMGADYIEQDIALTLDGVLICLHDDSLDRTARGDPANCSGPVATKTLAQLKTCDMGSWFNETYADRARPEYVGLPMPTLEEVFQRYGTAVNYYIETKTLGSPRPMEEELLRLINAYGLREGAVARRQVLVQSFTPESLQRMRALDADIPLVQLLFGGTNSAMLQAAAEYSFGVGPPAGDVTPALVDEAHTLGLAVHPYTINAADELERIGQLCVDGLFTNFPDRYRALVDAGTFDACPAAIR